jgi:hypothetical protein
MRPHSFISNASSIIPSSEFQSFATNVMPNLRESLTQAKGNELTALIEENETESVQTTARQAISPEYLTMTKTSSGKSKKELLEESLEELNESYHRRKN